MLLKLDKYYLTNNWFAKPESFIIMHILKTSIPIKDDLDTSVFYELSVKCLCVFNSEQKNDIEYVLRNIIFCSNFYPSEVLLQNLNIDQRSENIETSLSNMDKILDVYIQVLGLKKVSVGVPLLKRDFSCCTKEVRRHTCRVLECTRFFHIELHQRKHRKCYPYRLDIHPDPSPLLEPAAKQIKHRRGTNIHNTELSEMDSDIRNLFSAAGFFYQPHRQILQTGLRFLGKRQLVLDQRHPRPSGLVL